MIFITGDVETFDLITGLPTLVLDLSYSRDFEKEADTYALEQLENYDIPLESFATIMQRLEGIYKEDDGDKSSQERDQSDGNAFPDFLSTHPSTEDRIEFVERYRKGVRGD